MTIDEALAIGRKRLSTSSNPALDSRLLLEHVLHSSHAYLVAHGELLLSADQQRIFLDLLSCAAKNEPIPYLIGSAPFYDRDFIVNSAVLIPRPETEILVDATVDWVSSRDSIHLADVGTGSGCLAITLAIKLPLARIYATDISPIALDIAHTNAKTHQVDHRISFHHGSLLEPLSAGLNVIVANLPYIGDDEWTMVDHGVKWYEPDVALRGGPDGLELIRQLLLMAETRLGPDSAMFLEIGWKQGPAVCQLAQESFPSAQISIGQDYAGRDRIVSIIA